MNGNHEISARDADLIIEALDAYDYLAGKASKWGYTIDCSDEAWEALQRFKRSVTERCSFVVGHKYGNPVECGAVRAIHGDILGMAAHNFVSGEESSGG